MHRAVAARLHLAVRAHCSHGQLFARGRWQLLILFVFLVLSFSLRFALPNSRSLLCFEASSSSKPSKPAKRGRKSKKDEDEEEEEEEEVAGNGDDEDEEEEPVKAHAAPASEPKLKKAVVKGRAPVDPDAP